MGLLVALAVHALAIPVVAHWMVEGRRVARLHVTAVEAPAEASPGEAIRVNWTVANRGDGATRGGRTDRVVLATTARAVRKENALAMHQQEVEASIPPDGEAAGTATLSVPADFQGDAWLVVETMLPDGQRHHRAAPIRIAPYLPNLEARSLTAQPQGGVAGMEVALSYRVANTGRAAAEGRWADRVYLSDRPRLGLDAHGFATRIRGDPLPAGAHYTQRIKWTVPEREPGLYYLILRADDDDQLDELDKADNIRVLPFEIFDPGAADRPLPDLVLAELTAPDRALAGQGIRVDLMVLNAGEAPARGPWVDQVMLSEQPYPDDEAEVLASATVKGGLGPHGSYDGAFEVVIPEGLEGRYYLVAQTDAAGAVEERSEANNFKAIKIEIGKSPEMVLGQKDGLDEPTVAWISWDDYQDMVAPQHWADLHQPWLDRPSPAPGGQPATADRSADTHQPQDQMPSPPPPPSPEPVDEVLADPRLDPNAVDDTDAATELRLAEVPIEIPRFDQAEEDAAPADGEAAPDEVTEGELEVDSPRPDAAQQPIEGDEPPASPDPAEPARGEADRPDDAEPDIADAAPDPNGDPAPDEQAATGDDGRDGEQRGTEDEAGTEEADGQSPIATRQVPPVSPDRPQVPIRPGRVQTVEGIEIQPDSPRLPMTSRLAPWSANPVVRLTFDVDGRVVSHVLLRSSGDRTRDSEIISGLYRWRAVGERLEEDFPDGFWVEFRLLFIPER